MSAIASKPIDAVAKNVPTRGRLFFRDLSDDHLMKDIGLALDLKCGRMFLTDFGGSVYRANLNGSNPRTLPIAGNLTGIPSAEVA